LKSLYSIVCQRDCEKEHYQLTKYSPEERKRPMYYRSGNSTIVFVGQSGIALLTIRIQPEDMTEYSIGTFLG